jgi:hypothetical protein
MEGGATLAVGTLLSNGSAMAKGCVFRGDG